MSRLLYILCLLLSFQFSYSQSGSFDDVIEEVSFVSDNIYMIASVGGPIAGNIGVFVSDDGLIVIDDQYEINEEKILNALSEISNLPIKLIINTHFHHDHSDGNKAFGKLNIPIYAHKNVRKRLSRNSVLYGSNRLIEKYPNEALPSLTYSSLMSLYESDEEIQLYNFGKGHTDGDTVIFFKNSNVIHAGDTFVTYGYPYIDLNNGGSFEGFLNILNMIISLSDSDTKIIPGHGPICDINDVIKFRDIVREHFNKTVHGYKNGDSVNDIISSIESSFEGERTKEDFVKAIIFDLENN
jgi:glyoxylase-like metal-dependent hydrolase (beta-lactamase superfamily II)